MPLDILSILSTLAGPAVAGIGSYLGSSSQTNQMASLPGTGGAGNFLTGYGSRTEQLPRFTPEQQTALNTLLQRGLAGSDFTPIEERARTQFQQRTIPTIAERFTSMGGQRSSAFTQSLGQAGSDLEQGLSSLRAQYAMQQLGLGLTPTFENIYTPRSEGALGPILQGLGTAIPGAASSYFSSSNQNQIIPLLQAILQQLGNR